MKSIALALLMSLSVSAIAEEHAASKPALAAVAGGVAFCEPDDDTPFFKIGPRSKVLDSIVTTLGDEFKNQREKNPKLAKAVNEANALESAAMRGKLIENRVSFKEYEEIVRRWNEKEKRAVEVVPRTKREYRQALREFFDWNYDADAKFEREMAKSKKRIEMIPRRTAEEEKAFMDEFRKTLNGAFAQPSIPKQGNK